MSAKFNLEKIGNFFLLVMKEKIVNPFFSAMWAFPVVPLEEGVLPDVRTIYRFRRMKDRRKRSSGILYARRGERPPLKGPQRKHKQHKQDNDHKLLPWK